MATNALYVSIYQEILLDIQNGKYVENEPLPSEESLCRSYNVSRTTVHKALDMLKDADVVYSVQGNGVYVKPHMFAQPLSKFYSFTDSLKSINILIQNEIIDCIGPAPGRPALAGRDLCRSGADLCQSCKTCGEWLKKSWARGKIGQQL